MLNNENTDILDLASQKVKEEMGKRLTISDLYDEWIQLRMATKNPSTVKKDIWVWKTYFKDSDISKEILRSLKPPVITTELLKMARQRGLTQRKFREMKSVLNKILDYAVDMGYIFSNPSRQIHGISIDVFEEEEEKCKDDRIFSKKSLDQTRNAVWTRSLLRLVQTVFLFAGFAFFTKLIVKLNPFIRKED